MQEGVAGISGKSLLIVPTFSSYEGKLIGSILRGPCRESQPLIKIAMPALRDGGVPQGTSKNTLKILFFIF